jgi:hypothetical protein
MVKDDQFCFIECEVDEDALIAPIQMYASLVSDVKNM